MTTKTLSAEDVLSDSEKLKDESVVDFSSPEHKRYIEFSFTPPNQDDTPGFKRYLLRICRNTYSYSEDDGENWESFVFSDIESYSNCLDKLLNISEVYIEQGWRDASPEVLNLHKVLFYGMKMQTLEHVVED